MSRSFLQADVTEVVQQLSIDEKVRLLSGKDHWRTSDIPRLGIPSIKLTDGPNGARGEKFFKMIPATVLPNATCLAATFSSELAYETGSLLAEEAKARNASVILGPTVCMARNPLGGRTFESFSEDATLSGRMGSDYIRGLQENGVSACIKHFVANDQEHERMGADCVIRPRALREVYLRPFQIAQAYSKPWSYMTSYNKLNGAHCSENSWLLRDLLREEWGFDGLVMSDWYGTYSVAEGLNAGLDLEMPGEPRWRRKELVRQSINAHKTSRDTVDERVTTLLNFVQKLAKLNPDMVYDRIYADERTRWEAKDEDAAKIRRIAAEGIVLLKNKDGILPLTKGNVAVIGPNAKAQVLTGGGSARLRAAWTVTPWDGLVANKPANINLTHSHGCKGPKFLPVFGAEMTRENGERGFDLMHFAVDENGEQAAEPTVSEPWDNSDLILYDFSHPDLCKHYFTEIRAFVTAPITGLWEFEASVTGQGWLYIDDKLVLDISKEAKRTSSFFGNGTEGTIVQLQVVEGQKYRFRFVHDSRAPPLAAGADSTPLEIVGMKLGSFPAIDDDTAIAEAVEQAKAADVAVLVVGLNQDWESESFDRPSLALPLRMNELVERVAAVSRTVVVMQAGSAVSMPWIDKVDAVVYGWYGGNNYGDAIADIIYGRVNPSGRLPLTLPKTENDIAARLNANSARTKIYYDEGIWIGYKHHNARNIEPLFSFGHGLSYTAFEYSKLQASCAGETASEWKMQAQVDITNTGSVAGAHSAHFYLTPAPGKPNSLVHPEVTLQAYAKSKVLQPGETETVMVELDKYAISHWDELTNKWRVEVGEWKLCIGRDASKMEASIPFTIKRDMPWFGL